MKNHYSKDNMRAISKWAISTTPQWIDEVGMKAVSRAEEVESNATTPMRECSYSTVPLGGPQTHTQHQSFSLHLISARGLTKTQPPVLIYKT